MTGADRRSGHRTLAGNPAGRGARAPDVYQRRRHGCADAQGRTAGAPGKQADASANPTSAIRGG